MDVRCFVSFWRLFSYELSTMRRLLAEPRGLKVEVEKLGNTAALLQALSPYGNSWLFDFCVASSA